MTDRIPTYAVIEDAPTYLPVDLHEVVRKTRRYETHYTLAVDALCASAHGELNDMDGAFWRHHATNPNPDPGRRHSADRWDVYTMKRQSSRKGNSVIANWDPVPGGFEFSQPDTMRTVSIDAFHALLDAAASLESPPVNLASLAALPSFLAPAWSRDMLLFPLPVAIDLPDGKLFLRGMLHEVRSREITALAEGLLHVDSPASSAHEDAAKSLIAYSRIPHSIKTNADSQPLLLPLFSFTEPHTPAQEAVRRLWNAYALLAEHNSSTFPQESTQHEGSARQPRNIIVMNVHTRQGWASADASGREHDVRWLVRGHWRNQWYSATQTHRRIWIMPHIKGEPDKPFRPSPLRVYRLNLPPQN